MIARARAARQKLDSRTARFGKGAIALLAASVVSGISLVLISSGRIASLHADTVVFILLLIPVQTFTLTVAKFGIDQVVFAAVTADQSVRFETRGQIANPTLPVALAFAVVFGALYSPWAGLALALSIPLDVYSVMQVADLNARQRYLESAVASLLNYPVFFLSVVITSLVWTVGPPAIVACFCLASVVRTIYLAVISRRTSLHMTTRPVTSSVSAPMLLQQALNYCLYRLDVILLALIVRFLPNASEAPQFLFLTRFPELISLVAVSVGPVVLPMLFVQYPFGGAAKSKSSYLRLGALYGLLSVPVLIVLIAIYARLWVGEPVEALDLLPFVAQGLLIIPVYSMTYSMLRQGYIQGLLRNMAISLCVGALVVALIILQPTLPLNALGYVVAVQFVLFLALSFTISWGKVRHLYRQNSEQIDGDHAGQTQSA